MLNNKGHRYVIETQTWEDPKTGMMKVSYEYCDTLQEARETIDLIKSIYKDIPKPEKIETAIWGKIVTPKGATYWGYVLLDFETSSIVEIGGDGLLHYSEKDVKQNIANARWKLQNTYFLKPGEIPPGYIFQPYEFDGWLRYRWGDGANALSKVVQQEQKKKKPKWYQNNVQTNDIDIDMEYIDLVAKEDKKYKGV